MPHPHPSPHALATLACAAVVIAATMATRSTTAQCLGGGCPVYEPAHPAVVRIENAVPPGANLGSGTLVATDDRRSVVLTCAHLFREGAGAIRVAFADGQAFEAKLLATDPTWDLAALAIAPVSAQPVTIARDAPRPGEPLRSCGWGPDGRYRCNEGAARGYVQAGGAGGRETLELSGAARPGDSGGPVLNARGELVAVVWGTDGRRVNGTYCGRIRQFLAAILGAIRPGRRLAPVAPDGQSGKPNAESGGPVGESPAAPPVTPEDASSGKLAALARRLDAIETVLDKIEEPPPAREVDEESLAARVSQRLVSANERLEQRLADRLKADLKADLAAALAQRGVPAAAVAVGRKAAEAILPGVLVALGWTTPPSLAVLAAAWILRRVIRKRKAESGKRKPEHEVPNATNDPPLSAAPLNDDYARQLAEVYALSGRSPLGDVTLGREYDEELRRAEQSSDGALARWARDLRRRVADRFHRIHDAAPTPAEPIEKRE
ncbi:MAG: trypsin-like peptidase domain-containing protein [Pirellulales bacterium]|nr:trypsin-like peptidase domain-containing protein [Pirellulales bacterium]